MQFTIIAPDARNMPIRVTLQFAWLKERIAPAFTGHMMKEFKILSLGQEDYEIGGQAPRGEIKTDFDNNRCHSI